LGLVPTPEHDWATDAIEAIANIAEQHLDLNAILKISRQAPGLKTEDGGQRTEDRNQKSEVRRQKTGDRGRGAESRDLNGELGSQNSETRYSRRENQSSYQVSRIQHRASSTEHPLSDIDKPGPRIGIIRDSAFQFYYPENIDALSDMGAEVVFVSPLKDRGLIDLDALYIGGGFPETHAEKLAANKRFSRQLKALADDGFPIYAECGGLMYLGEKLILEGNTYTMVGILPVAFDFYKKPQGHGYTIVTVEGENPYYDVGTEIRGHEFHYSRVSNWTGTQSDLVFRMKRGAGIHKDRDGIVYKNVLATYTHVHALGTPGWAAALVRNAVEFRNSR
jgi:cobyrinic acid a,c-diamide synthase